MLHLHDISLMSFNQIANFADNICSVVTKYMSRKLKLTYLVLIKLCVEKQWYIFPQEISDLREELDVHLQP